MDFGELRIRGLFEITLEPKTDDRGFFMRTYDTDAFIKAGLHREWLQENHSRSLIKGVIRGLHFQRGPYAETKLVRCIRGSIFDVAVDLRPESLSFGQWVGVVLTEENMKMFYIPRGFAHGFCTMTDLSEVVYKVDNIYSPENEAGLLWNDPDLNIQWPVSGMPILSLKDQSNMTFLQFRKSIGDVSQR